MNTDAEDIDDSDDDHLDRTVDFAALGPVGGSVSADESKKANSDDASRENGSHENASKDPATDADSPTSASGPNAQKTPESSESLSENVGSWIGPYQLKSEIGAGGMGSVFMAEQKEPVARQVALKIIKAGMDSEQVIARFEMERQALSMMDHPNIAKVLDAGKTKYGRPFFVMELVHGEPITDFCDRLKLSIESRLEIFCEVCYAVQHAHQKGIIHRDLKPSNILVAPHNETGIPKIIDFGVAKATSQQLNEKTMFTEIGEVVGTLEYMSPEQAQMTDFNIDTRSDIYSLGVVLYELLTGSTPLNRQSVRELGYLEILSRITEEEATKPSSRLTQTGKKLESIADARGLDSRRLFNTLKGDLDWIVLKALEKDRTRRYDSATGFADDIKRYLKAEPVKARSPTGLYLLRKFVARHRASVLTAVAVFLTLVIGIAMTSRQARRARIAEKTVADQYDKLQKSTEVEKRNADLERKIERENEIRKANLIAQVRTTVGRGQWNEGMRQIDSIAAEFDELPIEILMLRLSVLDGKSKVDDLRREILQLEKHPQASRFESELQLWRGYSFLALGSQGENEKDLIQAAIDGGLEPDDKMFAEGLIANSLVDAVAKYENALKISPFHSKARVQLIVTFIVLGRYDQAQQQIQIAKSLFADDQRFLVADVVSHALANNIDETDKSLAVLQQRFPAANLRDVRSLIGLSRSINSQFQEFDRAGVLGWLTIIPDAMPLFDDSKGLRLVPIPEFQKVNVFNAYGEFASSFLNPLLPLMTESRSNRSLVEKCQKSYEIHPDGMFKCFEGWGLYSLGEYQKSSEAFDQAIKSDGLFPEIKRQALYGAFAARMAIHQTSPDQETLQSAIRLIESYLVEDIENHRALPIFRAFCMAKRWDRAREIAERMIAKGESKKFWLENIVNETMQSGNLGLALTACDEILAEGPDADILEKRKQVIAKIVSSKDAMSEESNEK